MEKKGYTVPDESEEVSMGGERKKSMTMLKTT